MAHIIIVQAFMTRIIIVQAFMVHIFIVQAFVIHITILQAFMFQIIWHQAFMVHIATSIFQAFIVDIIIRLHQCKLKKNLVKGQSPKNDQTKV